MNNNAFVKSCMLISGLLFCFIFFGSLNAQALNSPVITELSARNSFSFDRYSVPVTWGIPLSVADDIREASSLQLTKDGVQIQSQFKVLSRWGGTPSDRNHAIAWLLIDTKLDIPANSSLSLSLNRNSPSAALSSLSISENTDSLITVNTGKASYSLSKSAFRLFDSVSVSETEVFSRPGGMYLNGSLVAPIVSTEILEQGSERISVKVRGTLRNALNFTAIFHFFRDLAEVKIDFRLENQNPTPVSEFGQPQDNSYGSTNSESFDDFSLMFSGNSLNTYSFPSSSSASASVSSGSYSTSVTLFQESSGDQYWNILLGSSPRLQGGVQKRSSTTIIDGVRTDGPDQIGGWLDSNGVTVAVVDAWQNYPKAFRASSHNVEVGLFPGEYSINHELRTAEYKTHTIWVRHHPNGASDIADRAKSWLSPIRLLSSPQRSAETEAPGLFSPRYDSEFFFYEKGSDLQIMSPTQADENQCQAKNANIHCTVNEHENASTSVIDSITRSGEYGWVDYGDIPTDFESGTYPYNMKYDSLRGSILHALRNGGTDLGDLWFNFSRAAATHSSDIDIHHTTISDYTSNRRWFDGGTYGHLQHDDRPDSPGVNEHPHRNPINPSLQVSGPTAGLFLWYFLTGDALIYDSAIESANNTYWRVVNSLYVFNDNGTDRDYSSLAKDAAIQQCTDDECSGFDPIFGGRQGGNAISTLLGAFMATGDQNFLVLLAKISEFVNLFQHSITNYTSLKLACNRFHFESTFLRGIAQYILLRRSIGLPDDTIALYMLENRLAYMTSTLWVPTKANHPFRLCYTGDQDGESNFEEVTESEFENSSAYYNDNWLLGIADVFAMGAIIFNQQNLLDNYGKVLFDWASTNQFYSGSYVSYHFSKEFVNQIGLGNMFLYAWRKTYGPPSPVINPTPTPFVSPTPSSREGPVISSIKVNKSQRLIKFHITRLTTRGCSANLYMAATANGSSQKIRKIVPNKRGYVDMKASGIPPYAKKAMYFEVSEKCGASTIWSSRRTLNYPKLPGKKVSFGAMVKFFLARLKKI